MEKPQSLYCVSFWLFSMVFYIGKFVTVVIEKEFSKLILLTIYIYPLQRQRT